MILSYMDENQFIKLFYRAGTIMQDFSYFDVIVYTFVYFERLLDSLF